MLKRDIKEWHFMRAAALIIVVLGYAILVLAASSIASATGEKALSGDVTAFPTVAEDSAIFAEYADGGKVVAAFLVQPSGVRQLSKAEYTAILEEHLSLHKLISADKEEAYLDETASLLLRNSQHFTTALRWDMSQRVTPYLHNHSSDDAKWGRLCCATLQPLADRKLSLTERLRLRIALPKSELKPTSFSRQILFTVLQGHEGYVQFVPSIRNLYGYSSGKWTDICIPVCSEGLYEVINRTIEP